MSRADRWEAIGLDPGGSGRRGKETFEIGPFGEAHGVIDGMAGAVDLVQGAACLLRRPVHRREKALGAHPAGARGHHQRPARRQDAQRQPSEARIGCERAAHLVFALGERRRIDDHQAEPLPAPAQLGESRERVGCQHGMARGGHCREIPVERKVALGGSQRRCAGVEAQHLGRAAPRSVEGKAAGVGENVERAPARGQLAHARPVIALVEEEPRLLPPQHVGLEMQAVFVERYGASGHRPGQHVTALQAIQKFGPLQEFPAQAQHDTRRRTNLSQRGAQFGQPGHPGQAVELDDQRGVVTIDHQAGQLVVFAMHQAITRCAAFRQSGAPGRGRGQLGAQPSAVDGLRRTVRQDSYTDGRSGIVEADRQEAPPVVEDHRQVTRPAWRKLTAHAGDRLIEEPRMAAAQRALAGGRHAKCQPPLSRGRDTDQWISVGLSWPPPSDGAHRQPTIGIEASSGYPPEASIPRIASVSFPYLTAYGLALRPPDCRRTPPTPPRRETGAELLLFRTGAEVRGVALPDVWPGAPSGRKVLDGTDSVRAPDRTAAFAAPAGTVRGP